jgi:hypothetical protein
MAVIYSGATAGSDIIRYSKSSCTASITATSGTTTSTLDLENYLYTPANTATYHSIQDTINQYMTTGATVSYYSARRGIADSGTGTAGNWITDSNFNSLDNSLNIRVNFAESEEEIRKREKEHQRYLKQQKIKSNLLIKIRSRGTSHKYIPENEQLAMETLREYVTETEFRKYLRFGFICVEGLTGKIYQIFRNRSHTKVWKGGRVIDEICVNIKDRKVPPTDSVIAFRTMIQASEEDFYKLGNVYKMERAA